MPIEKDLLAQFINPVFIETGTYQGNTVQKAVELGFETIYSIEVDPALHAKAVERFSGAPNVHLLCGDTIEVLPQILRELDQPATFWLDAHAISPQYVGNHPVPIMQELAMIAEHPIRTHCILIDDRRMLEPAWRIPERQVYDAILRINPNYKITLGPGVIPDDVIIASAA